MYQQKRGYITIIICSTMIYGCDNQSSSDSANNDTPPIGLAARPSNSSCLAYDSSTAAALQLEAAFPNLPQLNSPLGMFQAPGAPQTWYLFQQNGEIFTFDNSAAANTLTPFADISDRVVDGGERGLLGFAFHPDFNNNQQIFLSYTTDGGTSVISRFFVNSDGSALDVNSEQRLLTLEQPFANHNGGNIVFGPDDGFLYIGFGDGGSGNDPQGHGQNTQTLLGSLLRIDVDVPFSQSPPYDLPADTPFVNGGGRAEIFAYGLRNPWRFTFDRVDGRIWLGDVGQGRFEEVDIMQSGGNYGWATMEGFHCLDDNGCDQTGLTLPVAEYDHSDGDCSITGGYVYRGEQLSGRQGQYIYGDFCSGKIRGFTQGQPPELLLDSQTNIVSFAQAQNGEIYLLNRFGDAGEGILLLAEANSPANNSNTPPQRLSETGCVDVSQPRQPQANTIDFSVASRLWSDNTTKFRAMALPDQQQISINDDGDFNFPIGTVLIKHFELNQRIIETRLFMRNNSGWSGLSYEWLDDGSDAILLAGAKDEMIDGQLWHYPSRGECLSCHTALSNFSLGPELLQLNQSHHYAASNISANQIATLDSIGLFSNAVPAQLQEQSLSGLSDTNSSLLQRGKSYLHSNCANCHQPNGTGGGNMDLRFLTAFADMGICDVSPASGSASRRLFDPGDPQNSELLLRMQTLGEQRMPPLASNVVDSAATSLISDWITATASCP